MAGDAKINGIAVAAIGAGALFLYAGISGRDIPAAIRGLIAGQSPATAPVTHPITGSVPAPGTGITVAGPNPTGNAIASDALTYQGAGYVWAGVPARGIGNWDCSSFANWVIGHDMGMAIPGYQPGGYDGTVHGPNTLAWLAWMGSGVTHIPRAQLAAGDIACWQTHMGIATGNNQMISAQNPSSGTQVSPVDEFISGEILFCLRLKNLASGISGGGRKK